MNVYYCLLLILLTSFTALSQNKIIQGVVTDNQNKPLIGVNIFHKKSNKGTQTNENGKFTLSLNDYKGQELMFLYLGFKDKKVVVTDENFNNLAVVMEKSNFALDEIIIVSNRDKESIDEIPSSVSVLTSKDLEAFTQNSNTLADVVANVPGVSLSTNTSTTRGQNIRGRNMLVMIDGIPQSTPLFVTSRDLNTIDGSVIERVEIIKGSTSIYGNGAEGGIINYITKKATAGKKLEGTTVIGSSGSLVNTDNTIGSTISQLFKGQIGKFNYIVSGSYNETGIMRSAKNEISSPYYGLGETETYNVFSKIGYDISDKSNIEFMYNYFSSNQNSNLTRVLGVYGETPTTGVYGITDDIEEDQGNRYNHNVKLKYTHDNIIRNTDLDINLYAQEFKTIYDYNTGRSNIPEGFIGSQTQVVSAKKGARLNFNTSYSVSDNLYGNLIYGLDLLGDTTSQPLVDGRIRTPEMEMFNLAPYLQVKSIYNEDLVFKGGVRYEVINVNVDDYSTLLVDDGVNTVSGGVNVNGEEFNYDALTFNLGLRYNKFKYFKPFVSFSQSFSVGQLGRILRNVSEEDAINGINSEAVIANNYEVGFKSNLTEKIRFQGVYFLSTSDLGTDYSENLDTGVLEIARAPEKTYGFEFQLDTKLTEKLDFGASVSIIEGKTDNNDDGDFDDDEDGYLGGTRITPTIIRSYVSYQFSPKWNARLSSTFSGNRNRFDANDDGSYSYGFGPVTSFTTTSLFSSYKLTQNTKVSLGIDNLFNEDYYTVRSQWAGRDDQYEKANGINFKIGLSVSI